MILRREIEPVGRIIKTHGIKGELNAEWLADVEPAELRCLIFDIDGIFVPFFLSSSRPRGTESYLLTFDGIDDERKAASLTGHDIYALRDELPEQQARDGFYADDLIGFATIANGKPLGTIEAYDDSTANVLFIVRRADGRQTYIPAAAEFIDSIDGEARTIAMTLPQEILTIND